MRIVFEASPGKGSKNLSQKKKKKKKKGQGHDSGGGLACTRPSVQSLVSQNRKIKKKKKGSP
jgi:hypothetical protein